MAEEKPAPVQLKLTQEQLTWMDEQAKPWRQGLMAVAVAVLLVFAILGSISVTLETTTTETTTVKAPPSTSGSPAETSGAGTPTSGETTTSSVPTNAPSESSPAQNPLPTPRTTGQPTPTPPASTPSATPSASAPPMNSETIKTTTVDDSRPSDTLLGMGFAVGLLLLLAAAFFTRAIKLGGPGGISFDASEPHFPSDLQTFLNHRTKAAVQQLQLVEPGAAVEFKSGTDATARLIYANHPGIDPAELADISTETTARIMGFK